MLSQPQELTKLGYTLEAAIEAAAKEVIALRDELNEWDGKAGDGDCGTTVCIFFLFLSLFFFIIYAWCVIRIVCLQMYRGASAVLEDMKKRSACFPCQFFI